MDDDECKTSIPIGKRKVESDIWQKLNNVSITEGLLTVTECPLTLIMMMRMMMRIMIMMKITTTMMKIMMIMMMRFVTLSWADVHEESSSPFGF